MHPGAAPDTTALPRIAPGARLVPAEELAGRPHVQVDGAALPGTVLSLSHWPGSGTPDALRADTSALIVARYLAAGADGPEVDAISTNHYDEDGLLAIWLLLERPEPGDPARDLAIAAAEAGDFGSWTDPWAPRVAIAAMGMAERGRTPFPEVNRVHARAGAGDPAGALHRAVLPRVRGLLDDPGRYAMLWRPRWEGITADMDLLDSGGATIEEHEAGDLAVLRTPRPLDPMAVHPRTLRTRVLMATPDGTLSLAHRYETWVDYVSRPLAPRVDLTPLAARLQGRERGAGRWLFEGVAAITPRLFAAGPDGRPGPTSVSAGELTEALAAFLEEDR